ncbi:hypothetical protein KKE14_03225 [Patescibacteria group bacterium]|nr:hypothetical protein [Patescibacteria group bacterium]
MPDPVSSLKVVIPDMERQLISSGLVIPNLNPQCGVRPLEEIHIFHDEDYANAEAVISSQFLEAQMIPRGRPHLALLHMALIDDDIASASFCAITSQTYGEKYRYVELWAKACFHKEAFLRGHIRCAAKGAVEVDAFKVLWELTKEQSHHNFHQRGVWRVSVLGIRDDEPIPVASLEGMYFRLPAVIRT